MQKINGELLNNKNVGFKRNKREKLRLKTLRLRDDDRYIIFSTL